jgi:preprotein translocase subunit SecG
MTIFLTVLHVLVCLVLIVVVLLQRGKGAEVGAVFGGGGSNTMFGARGAGNFLTRLTTASAVIFMLTSLTLAYFAREDAGTTLFEVPAGTETSEEGGFEAVPGGETAPTDEGETGGGFEEVPTPAAEPAAPSEDAAPALEAAPSSEDAAPAPQAAEEANEQPTP